MFVSKLEKPRLDRQSIRFLTILSAKIIVRISHLEDDQVVTVSWVLCLKTERESVRKPLGLQQLVSGTSNVLLALCISTPQLSRRLRQSAKPGPVWLFWVCDGYSISDTDPGESFNSTSMNFIDKGTKESACAGNVGSGKGSERDGTQSSKFYLSLPDRLWSLQSEISIVH